MNQSQSYNPNIRASLTRSKDGNVTATVKISAGNGGPPLILSATMPEAALRNAVGMAHGMATQYHNFLHAQGEATAGRLPAPLAQQLAPRLQNARRPEVAAALQHQTAAAVHVIKAARQGDPRAKKLVGAICALAAQGSGPAQRGRAALAGCASDPRLASAGCNGGAVSGRSFFDGAPAMDLHNYYQIVSGWGVAPESVGYTPERLSFPGIKGIWDNLRPHLGVRPEGAGFGVRDALRLGMQSIVHRELAA